MNSFKEKIHYYFWATYRRKILDELLEENKHYYKGIVLDIGGRDRGKFQKPKGKVNKWIFADIEEKHNPDVVLDVADMSKIKAESMNVVNAIELFEHVENIERGLSEGYRILKKEGFMIISVPFLFPIHADPYDFQRWTDEKWKKELENCGFKIEKFEIMGRYFTVLADMIKVFIKTLPRILSWLFHLVYPLLDVLIKIDNFEFVQNHAKMKNFHGGYFMIMRK